MTLTDPTITTDRTGALAERLVGATTAALELFSIQLGRELGLYEVLAERPCTADELAARAGIASRYAREWLEQQAVAGLLRAVADADADGRRFLLPEEHAPVLLDPQHPLHVAPMAGLVAGIGGVLAELPEAYRRGEGVPYAAYGPAFRRGQGGVNRPVFATDLATWLDALPDVANRLRTDGSARIADLGCGEGWSTLALARAFPGVAVDGYDTDAASIETARRNAAAAGLDGQISFSLADAASIAEGGTQYLLMLVFEALHDFARPREVLDALRTALRPHGALLVVDERVADTFTAPGDEVERMMYGWSVLHCLPASMADQPSAALGTVLRSGTVHQLAADAGFRRSQVLPLENDLFRFYRLDP